MEVKPLLVLTSLVLTLGAALGCGVPAARGGSFDGGVRDGALTTDTADATASRLGISGGEALTRIAAVLWQTRPDADLLAEADQDRLVTTADLIPIIQRMLADPRAVTGVRAFTRWWLGLAAFDERGALTFDPALFPEATPALLSDMARETETFGVDVTLALNGTFETLLTAPFSFVNERLAGLYGLAGIAGDELREVTLPPGRPGLLTRAAFLARSSSPTMTSPVRRGAFVDTNFFCVAPPPPPASIPPLTPPVPPGVTQRAALESVIGANVSCQACHLMMDPVGLAFEGFDAIGRVRTTDNGAPVDTSGLSIALAMPSGAIVGDPVSLATLLSRDPGAERCMAHKWLQFAVGGELTDADEGALTQITQSFAAAGFNLQALITAVLVSEPFLTDTPIRGRSPLQP